MKDDIQKKLLEFLLHLLQQTKELASNELPGVFKEWIQFKVIENVGYALVCFLAGALLSVVFFLATKEYRKNQLDNMGSAIIALVSGVASLILLCASVCDTFEAVQAYVAPRAYLLDHFLPKSGCK